MSDWFLQHRVLWIEETVRIFGFINREHVKRKFNVSTPQASYDIAEAMKRWPHLMEYNKSTKRYEVKP